MDGGRDSGTLRSGVESCAGRMEAIEEAQRILASEPDPDAILDKLAGAAEGIINAETIAVALLSEDRKNVRYAHARGKYAETLESTVLPLTGAGLCGWVLRHKKPILSINLLDDPRVMREAAAEMGIHTALVSPLLAKGEVIGGLSAFNKKDGSKFDEGDLYAVFQLSSYAALAVANARLMRDLVIEKTKAEVVLDAIGDGLVLISRDGIITESNKAARELVGTGAEGLAGKNVQDIDPSDPFRAVINWEVGAEPGKRCWELVSCHNEECDVYKKDLLRCWAYSNGYCRIEEYEVPGKDKLWEVCSNCGILHAAMSHLSVRRETVVGDRTLSVNSVLVMEKDKDEMFGELFVIHDVSAEKRLERQRREFISMLSHDLKTPLSSIISYCDMISQERDLDAVRQMNRMVSGNSAKALRMINNVLEFSRVESGTLKLDNATIGMGAFMAMAVEPFSPMAAEKGVGLSWETVPGTGEAYADFDVLTRIAGNLVSNALEHVGKGGHVRVLASTGPEGFVRLEVSDDGPGIDAERLPHIFEKYYSSNSGSRGSRGLGLAIVKALSELQGGSVGVESEKGRGSTFWVLIPKSKGTAS